MQWGAGRENFDDDHEQAVSVGLQSAADPRMGGGPGMDWRRTAGIGIACLAMLHWFFGLWPALATYRLDAFPGRVVLLAPSGPLLRLWFVGGILLVCASGFLAWQRRSSQTLPAPWARIQERLTWLPVLVLGARLLQAHGPVLSGNLLYYGAPAIMAWALLGGYAPAAVQSAWLPRIASGEALVVLAHQETKARYDLSICATRAEAAGDGYTLHGAKSVVPCGDQADALLVPAKLDGKTALFLVERGAAGLSARGYPTLDGGRAAEISLAGTPATLVTLDGQTALEHAVDIAIACGCAEAVGVMDQTVALTADYMNQRKQFNTAIANFQALRHRIADMKMQLELGRSMSYYASLKLNAPTDERRRALARAKFQLGNSMRFVGQQSVQLHGGIGVTDEYIGSHYFKKLTQLELSYGDTLHQLGEVSARMQDQAGVFA